MSAVWLCLLLTAACSRSVTGVLQVVQMQGPDTAPAPGMRRLYEDEVFRLAINFTDRCISWDNSLVPMEHSSPKC